MLLDNKSFSLFLKTTALGVVNRVLFACVTVLGVLFFQVPNVYASHTPDDLAQALPGTAEPDKIGDSVKNIVPPPVNLKWETEHNYRVKILNFPWNGPFVEGNSTSPRSVTKILDDETLKEWSYGGGFGIKQFYTGQLFGKDLPIELGYGVHYEYFLSQKKKNEFAMGATTRSGWSWIDGKSTNNSSALFVAGDTVFTRVQRKVQNVGVDLIARVEYPLETGELTLMAGPSFFNLILETEMYSYDVEPRGGVNLNRDDTYTSEDIDGKYYGVKTGLDFSIPVGENYRFTSMAIIGTYYLNAQYKGRQISNFSFNTDEFRTVENDEETLSYTAEVAAGIEYDTEFGTFGVSAEGEYLSKSPVVDYISVGTSMNSNYQPAHLVFEPAFSVGVNLSYNFQF